MQSGIANTVLSVLDCFSKSILVSSLERFSFSSVEGDEVTSKCSWKIKIKDANLVLQTSEIHALIFVLNMFSTTFLKIAHIHGFLFFLHKKKHIFLILLQLFFEVLLYYDAFYKTNKQQKRSSFFSFSVYSWSFYQFLQSIRS